jgi:hypothetical protein
MGMFSGASYLDLMMLLEVASSTICDVHYRTIASIIERIAMPALPFVQNELQNLTLSFTSSRQPPSSLYGCVAALDAYYHLRLKHCDRDKQLFRIAGRWFRPLPLNCGLSPTPWLFTMFLRPVAKSNDNRDTASFCTWTTSQERHVPTMGTLRQARPMPHGRAGKLESCLRNWGCSYTPPIPTSRGNTLWSYSALW